MPQMSPMSWTLLFIYFISLFLLFNVLNYFNFIPSPQSSIQQTCYNNNNNKTITWKW